MCNSSLSLSLYNYMFLNINIKLNKICECKLIVIKYACNINLKYKAEIKYIFNNTHTK